MPSSPRLPWALGFLAGLCVDEHGTHSLSHAPQESFRAVDMEFRRGCVSSNPLRDAPATQDVCAGLNCAVEPHTITVRGKTSTGEIVTASVTIILKTNCIR